MHKKGRLENKVILSTSPVAKVGAQTMYEFTIQKKEMDHFTTYGLENVEGAFSQIQFVAFGESKRLKKGETELLV